MSYHENDPPNLWNSMTNLFSSKKTTISPQQLKGKLKRNPEAIMIIDIRSRASYDEFHIPGAISLPPDGWHQLNRAELDPEKEIVVVCQQGIMSREALRILKERGFLKVMALKGGMEYWQEIYTYH